MKEQLEAGAAQLMIDPPFDSEMSGFAARQGKSQGVHDHLWGKALVITDHHEKVALLIADLVGLDAEIIAAVRKQTAAATGIEPEKVIVGATHTHSGPAVFQGGYLGRVDPAYRNHLIRNLAGAVCLANQNLEPVDLWVGESECRAVGKNRRKPGGSTDPQLLVTRWEGPAGTKALVVNYACHPVVLGPDNLLISADYPYYLRNTLELLYPGAMVMFVNGATGDINTGHSAHASINGAPAPQSKRTFAEARRLGRILAGQALAASENAVKQERWQIKFRRELVDLPLEPIPSAAAYQAMMADWGRKAEELERNQGAFGLVQTARTMRRWAEEMKNRAGSGKIAARLTTEIAALTLGDLELATLPGEFFHELGLQLKTSRLPRKVMLLGYTNGDVGYVANAPAYDEGGYEVDESYPFYGLPARLARGSGEQIVEALQRALRSIT